MRNDVFEPVRALDEVMTLFWKNGYDNTSFDRVISRMRTNRYRIYSTFGSKDDLLDQALERYSRRVIDPLVARLEDPRASLPEIRQFLEGIEALHRRAGGAGCLYANTAFERGQAGSAPARRVRRHFGRFRSLLGRALANARRNGELQTAGEIPDYADYLVGVAAGSFLLSRSGMGRSLVLSFLRTALLALPTTALRPPRRVAR